MTKLPNPTHRCRRCGHPVIHTEVRGWQHAAGRRSTPTCGLRAEVVAVQVPYERFPRWSITPQGDGYVIRRDREEVARAATNEEACDTLWRLADGVLSLRPEGKP